MFERMPRQHPPVGGGLPSDANTTAILESKYSSMLSRQHSSVQTAASKKTQGSSQKISLFSAFSFPQVSDIAKDLSIVTPKNNIIMGYQLSPANQTTCRQTRIGVVVVCMTYGRHIYIEIFAVRVIRGFVAQ